LLVEGQVGRRLTAAAELSATTRLPAEAEANCARRAGLPDLLNRRGLDEELARLREVTGVVLVDIDHFKHIDDRFGHQVGDRLLQTVAAAVRAAVRPADRCARYGGEERCVLLPGLEAGDGPARRRRATRAAGGLRGLPRGGQSSAAAQRP